MVKTTVKSIPTSSESQSKAFYHAMKLQNSPTVLPRYTWLSLWNVLPGICHLHIYLIPDSHKKSHPLLFPIEEQAALFQQESKTRRMVSLHRVVKKKKERNYFLNIFVLSFAFILVIK